MQYVPAVPDKARPLNVATPEIASTDVFPESVAPDGAAHPLPVTRAAETVPVLSAEWLSAESRRRTTGCVVKEVPDLAPVAAVDTAESFTNDNLLAVPATTSTAK